MPEFGFLKYFSEFCREILVRRDVDFDFGVEYFFQACALPSKGTAGMGKETFEPSGDS